MKCKSWSNKLNNFFTRKLTFLKINHQQQPLQQQQYQDCSSNNMPAMPKEKTTAFSLSKSDFSELQNKEQQDLSIPPIPTNTNDMTMLNNVLMEPEELKNNEPVRIDTEISAEENILKNGCGHVDPSLSFEVLPSTSPAITTTTSTTFTKNQLPSSSTCAQNHQNVSIFASPQGTTDVVVLTSTETSLKSLKTAPKKSAKDFVFGKYIGDGSFSTVYLGRDIHTKREYAIKVCEKRQILRESKQEYVRRERESLHILSNVPGFVNLHCTFQDNRSLYFVITYAKNGDLLPYINKVGSFDLDCTRHYAAELVLACENMHCRNVVHRDLKPENILLDENMHTLIADFGSAKILTDNIASILAQEQRSTSSDIVPASITKRNLPEKDADRGNDDDNEKDQEDSFHQRYRRSRKGSFVGTAQYVSPEVLQNGPITPAVDLWALGCIIYQMISGLPPFRGSNEYVIFKEIINGSVVFPQGFDSNAENLIRKFLKLDPAERIGALDNSGRYDSIRSHPFFNGIDFDTIREKTPPPIYPFLPGVSKDDKFHSHYRVPENLEPGLDRHQLTRLLSLELGTSGGGDADLEEKTLTKNFFDPSESEKKQLLEQQKSDKWHAFAENEVILKKGLVNKRKGLFARKRMLLLTTGPRLIYIDPVNMVKKGEIPWSPDLRAEPKNFKIFFVHTPNRTYYLEDPEGYCLEWVDAIDKVHKATYPD